MFDLRTEYVVDPLFIDVPSPRFSWKWKGGTSQSDYRIIVCNAKDPSHPVWDSGRIESSSSMGVPYCGTPLKSFEAYTVRVEGNGGSESVEGRFETALMQGDSPSGEWISMPYLSTGSTLLIRRQFTLPADKKAVRARAYVCGLGCHIAYLNGAPVTDEYFNPQVSVYRKRLYYNVYALDVKEGANVFGVELGSGWLPTRSLWAHILIDFDDGTRDEFYTDHCWEWRCRLGAVTENSIYGGETYDARLFDPLWCTDKAEIGLENGWIFSARAERPEGTLMAQTAESMKVACVFPAVSKIKRDDGVFVFDFGQNLAGWVRIRVKGKRGSAINIRYAELIDENNRLQRCNLRAARAEDRYILSGEGEEEYAPRFTYHGFRYAEMQIEGEAEIISASAELVRSGLATAGSFECSRQVLNRLHTLAYMTESCNLNGVYTDCPQRDERFGWLNDITSRIYQSVCNFDNSRYLPVFIRAITDEQRENGSIPDTAPFIIGGSTADPVCAYMLLGLMAYRIYGDTRALEENYQGFRRWFEFLGKNVKDGLLQMGVYGDWVPASIYSAGGGESPFSAFVSPEYVSSAYYVWYASIMQKIACVLGRTEDAENYKSALNRAKTAFIKRYKNEETGLFGNGCQTECAVAATAVDDKNISALLARAAAEDIVEKDYHTTCGNQGYRHLFYLLAENGYTDTLIRLLENPEYPGWGYMLAKGATTVWERWEDAMNSTMHSYNHPMFASYDAFFYNYIAGIRMLECKRAFGEIVCELPKTELVTEASATLSTVRGEITVKWKKTGKVTVSEISTPGNTSLCFRAEGIFEVNGKKTERTNEVRLSSGKFTVLSGEEN